MPFAALRRPADMRSIAAELGGRGVDFIDATLARNSRRQFGSAVNGRRRAGFSRECFRYRAFGKDLHAGISFR